MDDIYDVGYGQATDDGAYDDVETFGPDGTISAGPPTATVLAWGIVVLSLAGLWIMGAAFFKGSNQS